MKKFVFWISVTVICSCCSDVRAPYQDNDYCPNEHLMRMYEDTYIPWSMTRFPRCEPLVCAEWFIYIDQFYRDMTPAPSGGYIPPEDIVDYFYDEGTDRLYDMIFRSFC